MSTPPNKRRRQESDVSDTSDASLYEDADFDPVLQRRALEQYLARSGRDSSSQRDSSPQPGPSRGRHSRDSSPQAGPSRGRQSRDSSPQPGPSRGRHSRDSSLEPGSSRGRHSRDSSPEPGQSPGRDQEQISIIAFSGNFLEYS